MNAASPHSQSPAQPSPSSSSTPTALHPGAPPGSKAAPSNQQPGNPSFRRQRASRACETCHARKVRCDAASLGVPCTNCVAFSIECRIPVPRRKRANANKAKEEDRCDSQDVPDVLLGYRTTTNVISSDGDQTQQDSVPTDPQLTRKMSTSTVPTNTVEGIPSSHLTATQVAQQETTSNTWTQFMKPKFARAPIKEAGRVAYLGESSNLSLLVVDRHGTSDVVHYPLPENIRGARARLTEPDQIEIEILQQRGAFLLPPRALCDELVESFFKWVAPVAPVINRSRFMKRYKDPKNPPSLLLLQAILLAGSRVCTNPQLMDASGSTTPAAMTFYKRAKALYDANYEDDRITIVQALILMGWYWEGPEGANMGHVKLTDYPGVNIPPDVTKNVFYWTRVAIIVAQGSGMHRSVEASQLSRPDKRLWKRVWWTLFTRDRSVAVALGRPVSINTDDTDVEMLQEDDFIEEDGDGDYQPDPVHIQFFLQYVKLCEIMGLVLSQQYSVASKARRMNAIDLTHSDMALADWLQNCPREVYWERSRHHFWSALLHQNYYTTLCLLHRAHMPPATATGRISNIDMSYPSRTIAFQAAGMITSIVENMLERGEIKMAPAFIVYSLFSALIMHVYQMRSSVPSVVAASQERINVCMTALKEVSKVWLVAKMVHTLFESILGNKVLEERLQKATGRKVQRGGRRGSKDTPTNGVNNNLNTNGNTHQPLAPPPPSNMQAGNKRKFDEIDLGFSVGPPAPQVSYERSRPPTPSGTPSRETRNNDNNRLTSPVQQHNQTDHHLSMPKSRGASRIGSRMGTRANSPFNGFSMPGTPPDLFLVTRNSPPISQQLWENFQPDQLFPDGSIDTVNLFSPGMDQNAVDPQLQTHPSHGHQGSPPMNHGIHLAGQGGVWPPGLNGMVGAGMEMPDSDGWSNSSFGNAPVIPTTLNVEDWFQFFGIQGDLSSVGVDRQ